MINLKLDRGLFNDKFYPLLFDYSHRWEIYFGSAGSGKSYHITEKLIIRCCKEPIKILVCRRYATTLRQTVFALFKEVLTAWKIAQYVKINEGDMRIRFNNGSEIIFSGLDEETKLLSLAGIGTIFVEEAFECNKDIIEQLNLRLRGKTKGQQIILSFNPISSQHWLYDFIYNNPPDSMVFSHSTYKDNKFLSKEYVDSLEELLTRNPQKAKVFVLGEWGVPYEGLVLTNWCIEEFDPNEFAKKLKPSAHRVGADFGWQDPSAVISSFYDEENKTIYVYDEIYGPGITLDELHDMIVEHHLKRAKITADSAEPRTIDYFKRKGINMVPCVKGSNSVLSRIAFLQNHRIVILKDACPNFEREIANFSYEKDRKSGRYFNDRFTHEFSHSIDALGYAFSDIYTKSKLRTLDKSILGI